MKERNWIFVGGLPRSGTTLIEVLMTIHPECHIYHEMFFPITMMNLMNVPPRPPNYFRYTTNANRQETTDVVASHRRPNHHDIRSRYFRDDRANRVLG